MPAPLCLALGSRADAAGARQAARRLARQVGFGSADAERVVRPVAELAGDLWAVDWHADTCRIAVVDGLGHGPAAAAAALAAREVLAAHPDLAPEPALRLLHQALRGTRGAAISIAQIETAANQLIYAGVG